MQAQSAVNKMNYHLLGNRVAGETRRSRMARVNNRTSYQPSLTNQPASPQLNIRGAKPLNLGTTTSDVLVAPFVYGSFAFLTNLGIRASLSRGLKSVPREAAENSAIAASAFGLVPAFIRMVSDEQANQRHEFNLLDLIGAAGILTAGVVGPLGATLFTNKSVPKGRKRKEAKAGALFALPIALGVIAQGTQGFAHMGAAAIGTLAGIKASSMYKPAKRK